ncbi:MAG TPA: amidohydrolase [Thermomicrobiales bacterium]|nr:amidohydrolase [Thermomicrobiales bacterium]
MTDTLQTDIDEIMPGTVADRRWLHENPELGFQEFKTAEFVRQRLESLGVEDIQTGIAVTGVTGVIRGTAEGPGRNVLLRADMDALPMQEENDVDYKSQTDGVMHACGHDAHTAILMGVTRLLMERRDQFSGTVKVLFQPSEEQGTGGAKPMIEAGVLNDPPIDAVFGLHMASGNPTGEALVSGGPIMAAADSYKIHIKGRGGHAARPQIAIDPVLIGMEIGVALQTIVSRNADPMDALVISNCMFHAGTAGNVIPDTADMAGTVRTFTPEMRDLAQERLTEIATTIASTLGGEAEVEYRRGYPATVNDPEMAELVRRAAIEVVGAEHVKERRPAMGAEDFSYFLIERPGAFFNVGCRNDERGIVWGHHHPRFDVDEESLGIGMGTMVNTVLHYLRGE